jgi:hypothetical protein
MKSIDERISKLIMSDTHYYSVSLGELMKQKDCKHKIKTMEKEILELKGKEKEIAKKKYLKALKSCDKECGSEESEYYRRS